MILLGHTSSRGGIELVFFLATARNRESPFFFFSPVPLINIGFLLGLPLNDAEMDLVAAHNGQDESSPGQTSTHDQSRGLGFRFWLAFWAVAITNLAASLDATTLSVALPVSGLLLLPTAKRGSRPGRCFILLPFSRFFFFFLSSIF